MWVCVYDVRCLDACQCTHSIMCGSIVLCERVLLCVRVLLYILFRCVWLPLLHVRMIHWHTLARYTHFKWSVSYVTHQWSRQMHNLILSREWCRMYAHDLSLMGILLQNVVPQRRDQYAQRQCQLDASTRKRHRITAARCRTHTAGVCVLWERRCVRKTLYRPCPTRCSLTPASCSLMAVCRLFCEQPSLVSKKSNVILKGTRYHLKLFFHTRQVNSVFKRGHTSEFCFQARAPTPNFAQDWAKCYVFPQFFLGAHKSVCFCPQIWANTLLHASEFNLNTWPHAISRSRTRFPDPAWDQKQLCLYTNNPTQESCAVIHKFASRLSYKHNICSFFLFGVVNELTFFWSALRCCPSSTSRSQTLARMTMYSSFCTTDPTDRFLSVCLWWFPSRGR